MGDEADYLWQRDLSALGYEEGLGMRHRQGPAYTKITLQLVQLGRKAALCNVLNNEQIRRGNPTVWVPYSLVEDPSAFSRKHGPANSYVTIKVQHWFLLKENLIRE